MTEIRNPEIHAEVLKHFNEPVLSVRELCRLIGYGETGVDCYYICRKIGDGMIFWHSCVGGMYWLDRLKGQRYIKSTSGEDWDDFVRLDNVLELNGCPKEKEFLLILNHDDMEFNIQSITEEDNPSGDV